MDKDPNKWQVMADAQKVRRDELHEMRVAGSPWLQSMRKAIELQRQMEQENKQ
jgi:hypothetical protein